MRLIEALLTNFLIVGIVATLLLISSSAFGPTKGALENPSQGSYASGANSAVRLGQPCATTGINHTP